MQVHLSHDTPLREGGENGEEHPPPRAFDNELTKEDIQQQEDKIKELVEAGVGTTELHKFLQRDGKRLGEHGKQKVCLRCLLALPVDDYVGNVCRPPEDLRTMARARCGHVYTSKLSWEDGTREYHTLALATELVCTEVWEKSMHIAQS